jgi:hypothetical protein
VATLTHLLAIRIFGRTSSDPIFSGEWLRPVERAATRGRLPQPRPRRESTVAAWICSTGLHPCDTSKSLMENSIVAGADRRKAACASTARVPLPRSTFQG